MDELVRLNVVVSFKVGERETHSASIDISGTKDCLLTLRQVLLNNWFRDLDFASPVIIHTAMSITICREYREAIAALELSWIFRSVNWNYTIQLTFDGPHVPLDVLAIRNEVFAQICSALEEKLK